MYDAGLVWLFTLGFALLHSMMAAQTVKRRVYALGLTAQQYRLAYSIVGLLTTGVWLMLVHALPDTDLYRIEGDWKYAFYAVQGLGLAIAVAAFLPIDGAVFLGLKKAEANMDSFVVQGVYRYIRHPMYTGAILILLVQPEQSMNGLHVALAVSLYFILGSKLEEKRMLAEHPDYVLYQGKVGAFLPKIAK